MSAQARSLSIIVPVYNEEGAIAAAVRRIAVFAASRVPDFEIILVESGSTDCSAQECDDVAREIPAVRVLHEGARNGFGAAMRLGYANATRDTIWLVTVDLPFPLEAFDAAWPLLDAVPVVLSYRADDPRGLGRRVQSVLFNSLARMLLGLRVRHVNSAFKLYRRDIVQAMPLFSTGWVLDAEMLARLEAGGMAFAEIPVPLIDRAIGTSSLGWGAGLRVLRDLIVLKIRLLREGRPA